MFVNVETRATAEQTARDDGLYRGQVEYLLARSPFYQRKLREAGFGLRPMLAESVA